MCLSFKKTEHVVKKRCIDIDVSFMIDSRETQEL